MENTAYDFNFAKRRSVVQEFAETDETLNETTANKILRQLPGFSKNLAYNLDDQAVSLTDGVDFGFDRKIAAGNLEDNDYITILMFLQDNGYPKAKEPIVRAAIINAAKEHPTTSFASFLEEVKEAGHVRPNLYHDLMVNKLGAPDEEYSVFWLKSLMTAIYKHQTFDDFGKQKFARVPYRYFMFGGQGIGKSYMLSRLSNYREFSFNGDLKSKDTLISLSGHAIANADDTATQQTKLVDEIKSAITTPYFSVRLPYGKTETTLRNRAVFVGSTNRHQAYTDTTGDRREMPIDISVGMDDREAEKHGREWYEKVSGSDTSYFLDLWATFINEYEEKGFNPFPTAHKGIDERRREIIASHRRESDLTVILYDLFKKTIPVSFVSMTKDEQLNVLLSDDDDCKNPFGDDETTMTFGKLNEFNASVLVKYVKHEFGGRVSRATIVEAMRDNGYKEDTTGVRTFRKI